MQFIPWLLSLLKCAPARMRIPSHASTKFPVTLYLVLPWTGIHRWHAPGGRCLSFGGKTRERIGHFVLCPSQFSRSIVTTQSSKSYTVTHFAINSSKSNVTIDKSINAKHTVWATSFMTADGPCIPPPLSPWYESDIERVQENPGTQFKPWDMNLTCWLQLLCHYTLFRIRKDVVNQLYWLGSINEGDKEFVSSNISLCFCIN